MKSTFEILRELRGKHLKEGQRVLEANLGESHSEIGRVRRWVGHRDILVWTDGTTEYLFVVRDRRPNFYWAWYNGDRIEVNI